MHFWKLFFLGCCSDLLVATSATKITAFNSEDCKGNMQDEVILDYTNRIHNFNPSTHGLGVKSVFVEADPTTDATTRLYGGENATDFLTTGHGGHCIKPGRPVRSIMLSRWARRVSKEKVAGTHRLQRRVGAGEENMGDGTTCRWQPSSGTCEAFPEEIHDALDEVDTNVENNPDLGTTERIHTQVDLALEGEPGQLTVDFDFNLGAGNGRDMQDYMYDLNGQFSELWQAAATGFGLIVLELFRGNEFLARGTYKAGAV
ncbi:hypothetical protein PVAR5_6370 [Paecilomyces variotii No. 5]|uniref:Uncharacterized protein n=1 Tax=Byssochlamys spectabilis (strain No. 5 / NBRC 109023) TaxID=1356009 RepID=V5I3H8_BYSSN|nr:hypothetical protein PVAR5_6370 [Paecilomyces variotii No. 5]